MNYKEIQKYFTCLKVSEDQEAKQVHGLLSSKHLIALYKQNNENLKIKCFIIS